MTQPNTEQNASMEQILQNIRSVIAGELSTKPSNAGVSNTDVLDLTDMVQDDGSITTVSKDMASVAERSSDSSASAADILADIDTALDIPVAAPAPKIPEPVAEKPQPIPEPVVEEAPAPSIATPAKEDAPMDIDAFFNDVAPAKTAAPEPVKAPEPIAAPLHEDEASKKRLVSDLAAKASTEAFRTLLSSTPKHSADGPSFRSGVTLEELIVEALKPELSAWLDKNLPTLVTQLVEKEIKNLLPRDDA